jgi:hypothetical protein
LERTRRKRSAVVNTKALLRSRTRQARGILYRLLGGGKLTVAPLTDGRKGISYSSVLVFGGLIGGN